MSQAEGEWDREPWRDCEEDPNVAYCETQKHRFRESAAKAQDVPGIWYEPAMELREGKKHEKALEEAMNFVML